MKRRIDKTTRAWLKRRGLSHSGGNRLTQHLFGLPLMESFDRLAAVHMTPYGNSRYGARRELARILAAKDQFETVAHLFGGGA